MAKGNLPKLHSDFSVDCVIFGFDDEELKVLLVERNEPPFKSWKAIPGNLVFDQENIDDAAERVLYELTGLRNIFLEQFYSFGSIDRHPQGRVITVAYYSIIKRNDNGLHPVSGYAKTAYWWPADRIPKLAFDHNEIVEKALQTLRHKISYEPIGFELLPEKFTLTQLQHIYEAILQKRIDKRNFRRKMLSYGLLTELNQKQKGVSHRAASFFKFNKSRYRSLKKKGFIFGLR
ncbi:MAG: NUDIX hydrolase [Chitinophagales bacterium]|nr:NUDIX hydrolase [Chitinophagales bacterium]